ncbi:MAG TPA: hypothetical protein VGW38_11410 [Chloroflexota bacterium]|nr:hypothetical protein [Chloroflexota bacterium]
MKAGWGIRILAVMAVLWLLLVGGYIVAALARMVPGLSLPTYLAAAALGAAALALARRQSRLPRDRRTGWRYQSSRVAAALLGVVLLLAFERAAVFGVILYVFRPQGPILPVYAYNSCDESRHVVFHYDDSTLAVAGGDESIALDVPARSRAVGAHPIGLPASPPSMLRLEVFRSGRPDDEHDSLATHHYDEVPTDTVEGDTALLLEVPQSACES